MGVNQHLRVKMISTSERRAEHPFAVQNTPNINTDCLTTKTIWQTSFCQFLNKHLLLDHFNYKGERSHYGPFRMQEIYIYGEELLEPIR